MEGWKGAKSGDWGSAGVEIARATADLIYPSDCPACARPYDFSTHNSSHNSSHRYNRYSSNLGHPSLCTRCSRLVDRPSFMATPRIDPGFPVYSAATYGGVHRALIVAAKEHNRIDAHRECARIVIKTLIELESRGHLPHPSHVPWNLIPAPTTVRAVKERGANLVGQWCEAAARELGEGVRSRPLVYSARGKKDQVGLGVQSRRSNLSGTVRVCGVQAVPGKAGGNSFRIREKYDDDAWTVLAECRRGARCGELFIICDDVLTTGSTMSETALTLATHGITPTMGVTLCAA